MLNQLGRRLLGEDFGETLWRKLMDDPTPAAPSGGTTSNDRPSGATAGLSSSADRAHAEIVKSSAKEQSPAPVRVFRSLVRPPLALLTALDDGSLETGETWRLRKSRTVIGRVAGDIVIPHDPDISAEHAEVIRREQEGGHQWHLTDLGSTNGTFVRVQRVVLRNGKELLLGSRRLTFTSPDVVGPQASGENASSVHRGTHPHTGAVPADIRRLGPRLIEQTPHGRGAEHPLLPEGVAVGRDAAQCRVLFADDPFVDAVHARVFQDSRGRWILEDAGSVNGVWVRVTHTPLDNDAQFLVGGQRFEFRVL